MAGETEYGTPLALGLGGNGAAALAYGGLLAALGPPGQSVQLIAATGLPALLAAVYAKGADARLGAQFISHMPWHALWSGASEREGTCLYEELSQALEVLFGDTTLESLRCRLILCATDVATGDPVWLEEGPVRPALLATLAIPGLVPPFRVEGRWLTGGGVGSPLPVAALRARAESFRRAWVFVHAPVDLWQWHEKWQELLWLLAGRPPQFNPDRNEQYIALETVGVGPDGFSAVQTLLKLGEQTALQLTGG